MAACCYRIFLLLSYCHRYVFCMTAFCRRFSFQLSIRMDLPAFFHFIQHGYCYFPFLLSSSIRFSSLFSLSVPGPSALPLTVFHGNFTFFYFIFHSSLHVFIYFSLQVSIHYTLPFILSFVRSFGPVLFLSLLFGFVQFVSSSCASLLTAFSCRILFLYIISRQDSNTLNQKYFPFWKLVKVSRVACLSVHPSVYLEEY